MRAVKTESVGEVFIRQLYKPLGCFLFPDVNVLAWGEGWGKKV